MEAATSSLDDNFLFPARCVIDFQIQVAAGVVLIP
jgi:hypothetical protein